MKPEHTAVGGYDAHNTSRPGRYFAKNTDERQAKQNESRKTKQTDSTLIEDWVVVTDRKVKTQRETKTHVTRTHVLARAMGTSLIGSDYDGLQGPNEQRKGAAC